MSYNLLSSCKLNLFSLENFCKITIITNYYCFIKYVGYSTVHLNNSNSKPLEFDAFKNTMQDIYNNKLLK